MEEKADLVYKLVTQVPGKDIIRNHWYLPFLVVREFCEMTMNP